MKDFDVRHANMQRAKISSRQSVVSTEVQFVHASESPHRDNNLSRVKRDLCKRALVIRKVRWAELAATSNEKQEAGHARKSQHSQRPFLEFLFLAKQEK